jgi:hypothetical protein
MKQRFGALTVLLNGPRYFIMDSIAASGATKTGKTIEAGGGLKLTERATIDVGLLDLLHKPYREQTINRDTVYTFKAGRPVLMLKAADGSRYAMQAYAQIVDKTPHLCRSARARRQAQAAVRLALQLDRDELENTFSGRGVRLFYGTQLNQ